MSDLVSALVELEERVERAETWCRVVDAAAGDNPPDWLVVFWELVSGLHEALAPVSSGVRAAGKVAGGRSDGT